MFDTSTESSFRDCWIQFFHHLYPKLEVMALKVGRQQSEWCEMPCGYQIVAGFKDHWIHYLYEFYFQFRLEIGWVEGGWKSNESSSFEDRLSMILVLPGNRGSIWLEMPGKYQRIGPQIHLMRFRYKVLLYTCLKLGNENVE